MGSATKSGSQKGSRGNAPCRVQGRRPCWGLGQRPNSSSSNQFKRNSPQRCRQRSVPAPNFARPQTRPPSRSIQQLCCVAPNGCDQVAGLASIAALSRTQGISPLRRRVGGFAVAPDTSSQCTPMRLDFHRCRGNRACGRESGALRSPPTPLRSAHPCSLTVIAGWENRNCPPSAPQSFPHADAPDSQTAPPAPGTAARRPSAPQTG